MTSQEGQFFILPTPISVNPAFDCLMEHDCRRWLRPIGKGLDWMVLHQHKASKIKGITCVFSLMAHFPLKTSEILQYSACGEANEYTNVKICNLCFFS